jgi:hypothetical protein
MNPPQSDKLSILRAVLANLAGSGGSNAPSGYGVSTPAPANLQPPQTSNVPNVYGYPAGLPSDIRRVYDATQPLSQGLQGKVNTVNNMNTAYGVRDQLVDTLRSGMGGAPTAQELGYDTINIDDGLTMPTPSSVTTSSNVSKPPSASARTTTKTMASEPLGNIGSGSKVTTKKMDAGKPTTPAQQANPEQKPEKSASIKASPSAEQSKPSSPSKSAPVAQAEPSGEALSYFRKNKSSAGWDALGTAVSLVQQSLKPEKGGLKSRAEYDRLLRGSDNFKKLDGNEQQRVRQAFAQWMNEQTIFKGKA